MNEETRAFASILLRSENLTMKIGKVTAVTAPRNISCKIGGDVVNAAGTVVTTAPIITGIRRLAQYTPTVGDVVVLLVDEKRMLFIAIGNI